MSEDILDAKRLKCPMPIIEVAKKVKLMSVGEVVEIHATDSVFRPDIEAWCRKTKNELLSFEVLEGYVVAKIKKCS